MSEKLGRFNPDVQLKESVISDNENNIDWTPVNPRRKNIEQKPTDKKLLKSLGNIAKNLQQKTENAIKGKDYEDLDEIEKAERDTRAAIAGGATLGAVMGGGGLVEGAGLSGAIGGAIIGGTLVGKEYVKREAEIKKRVYEETQREQEINWKKLIEETENNG